MPTGDSKDDPAPKRAGAGATQAAPPPPPPPKKQKQPPSSAAPPSSSAAANNNQNANSLLSICERVLLAANKTMAPPETSLPEVDLLARRERQPPPPQADSIEPADVLGVASAARAFVDARVLEAPLFRALAFLAHAAPDQVLSYDWRGDDYASAVLRLVR